MRWTRITTAISIHPKPQRCLGSSVHSMAPIGTRTESSTAPNSGMAFASGNNPSSKDEVLRPATGLPAAGPRQAICSRSLAFVETVSAGTKGDNYQHAAEDRHVLFKVDLLRHGLRRRHRPEVMKDRGDHDDEDCECERRPARLETEDQRQSGPQFDGDANCSEHLRQWQTLAPDISGGGREACQFSPSRDHENHCQQHPADKRHSVQRSFHGDPSGAFERAQVGRVYSDVSLPSQRSAEEELVTRSTMVEAALEACVNV